MDYFFMSKEDEQASHNPLLVMLDERTGNIYARAVAQKGVGEKGEMEWLIKDMHEELKTWGYPGGGENELVLKSDGERAMVALRESIGRYHGGRVTPEKPAQGESQSNGAVENAGKIIRNFTKTLLDQMQYKADTTVSAEDPVLQWMVRWAAMAYSRYHMGKDRRSAYARQRGKECDMEVVPFGEKVWYKKLSNSGEKKNKMESDWEEGIWLGHA
eukprot:8584631-Karenia_brevis.AAC.1